MTSARALAWLVFLLWTAWLVAFQGLLATRAGAFTPELGIAWYFAIAGRMRARETLLLALFVGGVRGAFSGDPTLAVLVGYGALGFLADLVRRSFDVDGTLLRAPLAFIAALALSAYWTLARSLALPQGEAASAFHLAFAFASSTALAALFLPPLLTRLPGLAPLWGRRR
jgi:hypothetical protein